MFKVQIKDTNKNADNILLTDDLTIELLKIRYNWFLNASVKNCIIGEDSNGLVWYSGEWICGEWETGTWLSGIWHDGTWKNGKFYSYLIDTIQALQKNLVILEDDKKYSEFRSGFWNQGDFYNGTFGYDVVVSGKTFEQITGKTFSTAYWIDGRYYNGLFKNSVWLNGVFYNGDIVNSYWINGRFYNGTFSQYDWYNGYWFGGDFKQGNWWNGKFDQIDTNIKSRFGTDTIDLLPTGKYNTWNNGTFANGEFHSGLNLDSSGNTLPSLNSWVSQWMNGTFVGGKWYGGHFRIGSFSNSNWYGGVFNTSTGLTNYYTCVWGSGNWCGGLWMNGNFKSGHFYDGLWLDGIFEYGYLSTNTIEEELLPKSSEIAVLPPVVITYSATTVTDLYAYGNGRVSSNGGGVILDRGFCYGNTNLDLITGTTTAGNYYISDGGTMGSYSILISSLNQNTQYYYRAYAKNKAGVSYGDTYSFKTLVSSGKGPPTVKTYDANNLTNTSADLHGYVMDNGSAISQMGFYYDLYPNDPTGINLTLVANIPSGTFFASISSLTSNIPYNFVAFAINAKGTTLGGIKMFTTENNAVVLPTVTTSPVTNIGANDAIGHGEVILNGYGSITERGICWNTTGSPIRTGDHATSLGAEGVFSCNMTGLVQGTKYYVRAYAVNSAGDGYGTQVEFTTQNTPTVIMVAIKAL